jgi:hypothetical protein
MDIVSKNRNNISLLFEQINIILSSDHHNRSAEAIGTMIKQAGFDVNGTRISHFSSWQSKCKYIIFNSFEIIRFFTNNNRWRDCEAMDNGMTALHLAIHNINSYRGHIQLLPNAELIIHALILASAQPAVKIKPGIFFRGDGPHTHAYTNCVDALELAFTNKSPEKIILLLLTAHTNPAPILNNAYGIYGPYGCVLSFALCNNYSSVLIRQLLKQGNTLYKNINRLIGSYELACIGAPQNQRLIPIPITPICLKRWSHTSARWPCPSLDDDQETISVLAEYGAEPDPYWHAVSQTRPDAWLRGRIRVIARDLLLIYVPLPLLSLVIDYI